MSKKIAYQSMTEEPDMINATLEHKTWRGRGGVTSIDRDTGCAIFLGYISAGK